MIDSDLALSGRAIQNRLDLGVGILLSSFE
jgi:hypothetical protein